MSRKLYVSPYQPGDIGRFTPRPDMAEEMKCVDWDWAEGPPPGRTWTLMRRDGEVLGVGGLYERGEGHFDAWAVLATLERRDWPGALWQARRLLDCGFRFMGAKRIDASARVDVPGAERLLQKAGFKRAYVGIHRALPQPALYVFMQRAA